MREKVVGRAEMASEPVAHCLAIDLDRGLGLGPGEDGAEGNADDVKVFMASGTLASRVDQFGKAMPGGRRGRRHAALDNHRTWTKGKARRSASRWSCRLAQGPQTTYHRA
jgi:hypothetical protein